MKQTKQAGMSGKGFYAALSLSVAMVGAACWYAWSEADKLRPPAVPESSSAAEISGSAQHSAPVQTAARTDPPPQTAVSSAEAEEAAAILRRTTTAVPAPAVPEETAQDSAADPEPDPAILYPMLPVSGPVTERFSQGELVKSPTTGIWSTHNGADYAVPTGTEVLCTEDGTVSGIVHDPLWGVTVTVLHENGTVTRYCGLHENLSVQAGDIILRGAVLGTVGDTNEAERNAEPHLHFEVLHNDSYVDPESYFAGALSPQITPSA